MNQYSVASSFEDRDTLIFHYPAQNKTGEAVFILKGLYGAHTPFGDSWDNKLIELLQNDYDVFLFRTGRTEMESKPGQFEGKTFAQECTDLERAASYVFKHLLPGNPLVHCVALSFGGTTLLGTPSVLERMQTIVLISSGCGKNPETTKPLLSTLPNSDILLRPLHTFSGSFIFIHGGMDTIVPADSQRKIYEVASKTKVRAWIEYPSLGHELEDTMGSRLPDIANEYLRIFSK